MARGELGYVRGRAGGLVVVQVRHVVAIYDEQGEVKLATAAGGGPYPEGYQCAAGGGHRLQRRGFRGRAAGTVSQPPTGDRHVQSGAYYGIIR